MKSKIILFGLWLGMFFSNSSFGASSVQDRDFCDVVGVMNHLMSSRGKVLVSKNGLTVTKWSRKKSKQLIKQATEEYMLACKNELWRRLNIADDTLITESLRREMLLFVKSEEWLRYDRRKTKLLEWQIRKIRSNTVHENDIVVYAATEFPH